jgi:uroporphyrin-III C-methyltransferase
MNKGKIILLGAGPGDPELITVKGAKYLQKADVIITDRLVSKELIQQYANPAAKIIFAGKEGHSGRSTPQPIINDLLVSYYSPDKLVIRLKGGDIAFFSNVLDELETLTKNDIPFEIIPGITAASGASACATIPLTARGYASGVRFLTYSASTEWDDTTWQGLATTKDTLVLYMSACRFQELATELIARGASPNKPAAVIEQATTPYQQVQALILSDAATVKRKYKSPSLIIIGDVVHIHEEYTSQTFKSSGHYFDAIHDFSTKEILIPC